MTLVNAQLGRSHIARFRCYDLPSGAEQNADQVRLSDARLAYQQPELVFLIRSPKKFSLAACTHRRSASFIAYPTGLSAGSRSTARARRGSRCSR